MKRWGFGYLESVDLQSVWYREKERGEKKVHKDENNSSKYHFVFMLCTVESLNLLLHEARVAYF